MEFEEGKLGSRVANLRKVAVGKEIGVVGAVGEGNEALVVMN